MTYFRKFLLKGAYILAVLLTLAMLALLILPRISWEQQPEKRLQVWVIDKTVPKPEYREHKGLFWVLDYNKIRDIKGADYNYKTDYYGFYPDQSDNYSIRNIPDTADKPDVIYIADTYGVYSDDLAGKINNKRSKLVYGGLKSTEIQNIQKNLGDNLLIGEFNIASSPTNEEDRQTLSNLFGIKWTGWKGRYFKDLSLDSEIPEWLPDTYQSKYKKEWRYSGSGYVFVSDQDDIFVLEKDRHVGSKGLTINMQSKEYENIEKGIPYYYWFEFVEPRRERDVIANYTINLTEEGKQIFKKNGLPETFPAIVENKGPLYKACYFAGDFADMKYVNPLWKYDGLALLKKKFTIDSEGEQDSFFWKFYVPLMTGMLDKAISGKQDKVLWPLTDGEYTELQQGQNTVQISSHTTGAGFSIYQNGKWADMFIKGVNIGAALPGKWFTQFPTDVGVYEQWMQQIGEMNANSIRTYTLLPPEFYEALYWYNQDHKNRPLYLFQEIWPEENPPGHDYLGDAYNASYQKEIQYAVDAVHGNGNIPLRTGRAYGIYQFDVSPYIAGFLVGREMEPVEVLTTDKKHIGYKFSGEYLSSSQTATPTEGWLAASCDYVVDWEMKHYGWQHPVSIVSWPTLDPVSHDSEWNEYGDKSKQFNDSAVVDINQIDMNKDNMLAGFFGSYHIYPNYPDFMNNEEKYNSYSDSQGRLRYGGYLQEFMQGHKKYPALVAEFGLATGMGIAHYSPDGYNHGGMTEVQQGEGIVRMMEAIRREQYAGGLIFEWQDEWAKKTWTTEPFMIPYEQHILWHNAVDPEQNYGLLAHESTGPEAMTGVAVGSGEIKQIWMGTDASYLYLKLQLKKTFDINKGKLLIGLDTYSRKQGETNFYSEYGKVPGGMEFVIQVGGGLARMLVQPEYNIAQYNYHSAATQAGKFVPILQLVNKSGIRKDGSSYPSIRHDCSMLTYGELDNNTSNNWSYDSKKNEMILRIPWTRINFTDPSNMIVLNDPGHNQAPLQDELKTTRSDGIMLYALAIRPDGTYGEIVTTPKAYTWQGWDKAVYNTRLKESYDIIRDYFLQE